MLREFKAFIVRGNVLDLAIAVIVGAAFGRIVTSLTEDMLMPIIGTITGGLDFSSHFLLLGEVPAGYAGSPADYAALKKAGVPLLGWGAFVTQVINFVIVAFIIFLIIRAVNRMMPKAEPVAVVDPAEVVLLREIRDELKARRI